MKKIFCLNNIAIENYDYNYDIINSIKNAIEYDISQLDVSERTNTFDEHVKSLETIFSYFISGIKIVGKNEMNMSFFVCKNSEPLFMIELNKGK